MKALDLGLVFLGGGVGSVLRYSVGVGMTRWLGSGFPAGTLLVNVIGSFAIGYLAVALSPETAQGASARLLLMTGVLGGFTTFSAFSLDVVQMIERGESSLALAYVALSLILSVMAAMVGLMVFRLS